MHLFITETGKRNFEKRIAALEQKVKEIQAEKAIAYTASGDGWHDNPGFNQLEQLEFRTIQELVDWKTKLGKSVLWDGSRKQNGIVQIGSIVEFEQRHISKGITTQMICEIVGHGESDLRKGKISYDSPIGGSLYGKSHGDIILVEIPLGKLELKIKELK